MKAEYPPLLPPGIHDFSVDALHNVFVLPFQSDRREYLYQRLRIFSEHLQRTGISCEVWIDGSFCTGKPDPGDVDIVVFVNPDEVNSLPQDKLEIMEDLLNREETIDRFNCDAYFCDNTNPAWRSYWRGWFGFTRAEVPKGIARVIV